MIQITDSHRFNAMTTPHATAVIDLGLLAENVRSLRERSGTALMAVVKADAYGHGLVPSAQAGLSMR